MKDFYMEQLIKRKNTKLNIKNGNKNVGNLNNNSVNVNNTVNLPKTPENDTDIGLMNVKINIDNILINNDLLLFFVIFCG